MSEACDSFSQHAWKQDLCANCLKPRDKHANAPVPAKRPVKPARPASRTPSNAESSTPPETAQDRNGGEVENGNAEKLRTKPEARVKPTIAAKPGGLKQGSPEAEGKGRGRAKPAVTAAKPTISPKSSVKSQKVNCEPRSSSLDAKGDPGIVVDGGIYGAPSAGGNTKQAPADGAYDIVPKPVAVPESNEQHYYSKYDVSFKGMSGCPAPVASHVRNPSVDRLKYDIDIVMPYTVVDISTDPPGVDPDGGGPPGMPASGPPDKDTNGRGRSASPLARGSPTSSPLSRRKDGGSPKLRHFMRMLESGESPEGGGGGTDPSGGGGGGRASPGKSTLPFRSPTTTRKMLAVAPPGTDNGVYEDVEDPADIATDPGKQSKQESKDGEGKFARNIPSRSSSQKSAVFEAKVSTIALSLDFHKQKATGKCPEQATGPSCTESPPSGDTELIQVPISKKDKKKAAQAAKEETRPEKTRKGSVGKSFFRKLFGLGSGSAESEEGGAGSNDGPTTLDSDVVSVGSEEGQGTSKGSSLSASVENSPRLPRGRVPSDTDEKLVQVAKSLSRVESVREPALFNAELKQALARNSSIGEKDIAGAIAKYRESKREGSAASDGNYSPALEKKLLKRVDDPKTEGCDKSTLKQVGRSSSESQPQRAGPESQKSNAKTDQAPPSGKDRKSVEGTWKDTVPGKDRHSISIEGPAVKGSTSPVRRTSMETCGLEDVTKVTAVSKPDVSAKPEVKAKPEKSRRAPAAPPPLPPPSGQQTNRRSSCTSPVSPRPNVPPPPSPKYPDPSQNTPSKSSSPTDGPASPKGPLSPTNRKDGGKGETFSEIYGRRPEISAPRLDRTSAIIEVNVGMIEAGGGSTSPPPCAVSPRDSLDGGATHGHAGHTMTLDRKPRPKSELHAAKGQRRKPASAPPPPPDGGRRLSGGADLQSPPNGTPRPLSSFTPEEVRMKTQTLPRPTTSFKEVPTGRQAQRPKGRQFRSKTLSEGMSCDVELINTVLKHDTLTNLSMELSGSKFSSRKLPSPPPVQEEEFHPENVYETVSPDDDEEPGDAPSGLSPGHPAGHPAGTARVLDPVSALLGRDRRERSTTPYEDVEDDDDMFADTPSDQTSTSSSSAQSKTTVVLKSPVSSSSASLASAAEPSNPNVMTTSSDYLAPVLHDHSPDHVCGGCPGGPGSDDPLLDTHPLLMNLGGACTNETNLDIDTGDWRPKPIPRRKLSPRPAGCSSSYVVMYTNDELGAEPGGLGFTLPDGWERLTGMQMMTLLQIREAVDSMFVRAPASPTLLRWSDFSLESETPVYSHEGMAYYRVSTNKLSIRDCMLMISVRPLPTDVPPQPHVGVLHPSALYQDHVSSSYFPDVSKMSDPHVYGPCGMVPTTVWVLPFASVCTLEDHCMALRGLYAIKPPVYHRALCTVLQQTLSAILYLLDQGCTPRCFQTNEVLGVTPSGLQENYVLVLPHHCHITAKSVKRGSFVAQLRDLILYLIQDSKAAPRRGTIPSQTRYSRGLNKVAMVLEENTIQTIIKAHMMCQFMLWGPGEQEIKAVLTSACPQEALAVWLDLSRANTIGRFAIEDFVASKEDAQRVFFLSTTTGAALWDAAQLLQG